MKSILISVHNRIFQRSSQLAESNEDLFIFNESLSWITQNWSHVIAFTSIEEFWKSLVTSTWWLVDWKVWMNCSGNSQHTSHPFPPWQNSPRLFEWLHSKASFSRNWVESANPFCFSKTYDSQKTLHYLHSTYWLVVSHYGNIRKRQRLIQKWSFKKFRGNIFFVSHEKNQRLVQTDTLMGEKSRKHKVLQSFFF